MLVPPPSPCFHPIEPVPHPFLRALRTFDSNRTNRDYILHVGVDGSAFPHVWTIARTEVDVSSRWRNVRREASRMDLIFFFLRKGEVWRGLIRNVLITSKFYVYVFLDKRTVRTVSGANYTHKYTRSNTIISNLTLCYLCYTEEIHLQHDYFPINVHTTSHYAGG